MKQLFFILFLINFLSGCSGSKLDDLFINKGFKTQLGSDFTPVTNSSGIAVIVTGENKAKDEFIRVQFKDISEETLLTEVKNHILLILSQYRFTTAPYPGQLTEAVNCGKKFFPVLVTSGRVHFYKTYTNDRFALTICDSDNFKYKFNTAYFVNSQKTQLMIIDYYFEKDKNAEEFFAKYFSNVEPIKLDSLKNLYEN